MFVCVCVFLQGVLILLQGYLWILAGIVHGNVAIQHWENRGNSWKSIMGQVIVVVYVLEVLSIHNCTILPKSPYNSLGSVGPMQNLYIIHLMVSYVRAKRFQPWTDPEDNIKGVMLTESVTWEYMNRVSLFPEIRWLDAIFFQKAQ